MEKHGADPEVFSLLNAESLNTAALDGAVFADVAAVDNRKFNAQRLFQVNGVAGDGLDAQGVLAVTAPAASVLGQGFPTLGGRAVDDNVVAGSKAGGVLDRDTHVAALAVGCEFAPDVG